MKIDFLMDQETLYQRIRRYGKEANEARQISERLKRLLPMRIRDLARRKFQSEAKAYLSDDYHALITEWVNVQHQSRERRILYEIYMMILEGRKTVGRR